jgi:hypothetical protein
VYAPALGWQEYCSRTVQDGSPYCQEYYMHAPKDKIYAH